MKAPRFSKSELAAAVVRAMPEAPVRTIARVLVKKHPRVFHSIENARTVVRAVTGTCGKEWASRSLREDIRRERVARPELAVKLPRSVAKRRTVVHLEGRALGVLPDLHVPYHDEEALEKALDRLEQERVDAVLFNGDLMDCYALSFWETDPRERKLKREVDSGRAILKHVRERFPKARLYWKLGNHEDRWLRYLMQNAAVLLDVPEFQLEKVMETGALGVEVVPSRAMMRFGKLKIIHGHEFGKGVTNPVNPARGLFLRAKESCMCSHHHAVSQHTSRTLGGKIISTWSTGCLCDLSPDYRPLNDWTHGVAIVRLLDAAGNFHVDNLKIIEGRVF